MSTVSEIEACLGSLSDEDLIRLDRAVRQIYRQRHDQLIYDDSYGRYSESDITASAETAFLEYDREEAERAKREKR
ncbi:MAG TPA: hypothetical protein VGE41_12265 [Verrucomicrobiae bacterium]